MCPDITPAQPDNAIRQSMTVQARKPVHHSLRKGAPLEGEVISDITKVAHTALDWEHLTSGAAKAVYRITKESVRPDGYGPEKVLLVAKNAGKVKELACEFLLGQEIKQAVEGKKEFSSELLGVDIERATDREGHSALKRIDGVEIHGVVYEQDKALGDVEALLRGKLQLYPEGPPIKLNVDLALKLTGQLLYAMTALHEAGYTHGDLKPDNLLVFANDEGELNIRVADFGKTHLEDRKSIQSGNTRCASPDGSTSIKGESWPIAVLITEILEMTSEVTTSAKDENPSRKKGDPLLDPKPQGKKVSEDKPKSVTGKERIGIEAFFLQNPKFPAVEPVDRKSSAKNNIKRVSSRFGSRKRMPELSKSFQDYQATTIALIPKSDVCNEDQKSALVGILQDLTRPVSQSRIGAKEAMVRFNKAFPAHEFQAKKGPKTPDEFTVSDGYTSSEDFSSYGEGFSSPETSPNPSPVAPQDPEYNSDDE